MRSRFRLFCLISFMGVLTAGCISETAVQKNEEQVTDALLFADAPVPQSVRSRKIIDPSGVSMQLQATVAREFSNTYLDIAKNSAQSRDALTAVVIGAAAFTGYGLVEGLSDAVVAERAVIGLAINEAADYASPPKATDALYLRIQLREGLRREVPKYEDVFARFKNVVADNLGRESNLLASAPNRLDAFTEAVEACLTDGNSAKS